MTKLYHVSRRRTGNTAYLRVSKTSEVTGIPSVERNWRGILQSVRLLKEETEIQNKLQLK